MRLALILLVLVGLGGRAAATDDREAARRAYVEGRRHYDLAQYDEALRLFKRAYLLYENPALLYNIGQCHRHLGQRAEALQFFRTYLRLGAPKESERREVEDLVAQLEKELAPPPPPPAAPPPPELEKSGRFMLDLKLGAGVPIYDSSTYGAPLVGIGLLGLTIEFGVAVWQQRLYLVLPLGFVYGRDGAGATLATFELPLGIHLDVRLPVRGLYVTTQLSVGYVRMIKVPPQWQISTDPQRDAGMANPQLGIKYVIRKRGQVGADLLSFPVYFARTGAMAQYRALLYAGLNF